MSRAAIPAVGASALASISKATKATFSRRFGNRVAKDKDDETRLLICGDDDDIFVEDDEGIVSFDGDDNGGQQEDEDFLEDDDLVVLPERLPSYFVPPSDQFQNGAVPSSNKPFSAAATGIEAGEQGQEEPASSKTPLSQPLAAPRQKLLEKKLMEALGMEQDDEDSREERQEKLLKQQQQETKEEKVPRRQEREKQRQRAGRSGENESERRSENDAGSCPMFLLEHMKKSVDLAREYQALARKDVVTVRRLIQKHSEWSKQQYEATEERLERQVVDLRLKWKKIAEGCQREAADTIKVAKAHVATAAEAAENAGGAASQAAEIVESGRNAAAAAAALTAGAEAEWGRAIVRLKESIQKNTWELEALRLQVVEIGKDKVTLVHRVEQKGKGEDDEKEEKGEKAHNDDGDDERHCRHRRLCRPFRHGSFSSPPTAPGTVEVRPDGEILFTIDNLDYLKQVGAKWMSGHVVCQIGYALGIEVHFEDADFLRSYVFIAETSSDGELEWPFAHPVSLRLFQHGVVGGGEHRALIGPDVKSPAFGKPTVGSRRNPPYKEVFLSVAYSELAYRHRGDGLPGTLTFALMVNEKKDHIGFPYHRARGGGAVTGSGAGAKGKRPSLPLLPSDTVTCGCGMYAH